MHGGTDAKVRWGFGSANTSATGGLTSKSGSLINFETSAAEQVSAPTCTLRPVGDDRSSPTKRQHYWSA